MMFPQAPMLNMFLALFITLALILGLALILRRLGPGAMPIGKGQRLRKVESLPLTPQHQLHVVELDGRERLILTSPHGATELSTKAK